MDGVLEPLELLQAFFEVLVDEHVCGLHWLGESGWQGVLRVRAPPFIGPNGTKFSGRAASIRRCGSALGSLEAAGDGQPHPRVVPARNSHAHSSALGLTGPDTKQGLLTTSRARTTIYICTTQVFNEQGGGAMYRRMGLADTHGRRGNL